MKPVETRLPDLGIPAEGLLVAPSAPRAAILVLSGSSGRIEAGRARAFAATGIAAIALRWFGGPGQPQGICEVPLETFGPAIDRLADLSDCVGVLGSSKGAEAALLLAASDSRIQAVAAVSPPSVVFANVGAGLDGREYPYRSSWTCRDLPLPFVSYDESWKPDDDECPSFRDLYLRSLQLDGARREQAAIPVERIRGRVLVTAGGDDRVWPSDLFCEQIVDRRQQHGLRTESVTHAAAGHRPLFPGEPASSGGLAMARGGVEAADREHGSAVWRAVLRALLE